MKTAAIVPPFDEGNQCKLAAHRLLAARREAIVRNARRALLTVLLHRSEATIDDVRRAVAVPEGIDPVCIGAVPGELARLGLIERIGYAPTNRVAAHARPVSIWKLIDRDGAFRWLAAHAEMKGLPEHSRSDDLPTLFDLISTNDADPTVAAVGPDKGGSNVNEQLT